jgi:hypothetical protein
LLGADLSEANLNQANLTLTNLIDIDLSKTDLTGAKNLDFEKIKEAYIDEETKLPNYLETRRTEILEISNNRKKKSPFGRTIRSSN